MDRGIETLRNLDITIYYPSRWSTGKTLTKEILLRRLLDSHTTLSFTGDYSHSKVIELLVRLQEEGGTPKEYLNYSKISNKEFDRIMKPSPR